MSPMLFRGVVCAAALLSMATNCMQQAIMRDNTGYKVFDKGHWNRVNNYDVDPTLRKMNKEQLCKYMAAGCKIRAKRCSNGDYVLRTFVPGKGGGPVTGFAAYWATKVICYGTAAAATATVVVATAPAAAAFATGAAATVAAGSIAAGAGTAAVAGITAEVAAGVVAGGIAAAGAEGAAAATVATVSAAGGIGAAVAAVEAASWGVGAFFTAIPFLP